MNVLRSTEDVSSEFAAADGVWKPLGVIQKPLGVKPLGEKPLGAKPLGAKPLRVKFG